MIMMEVGLFEKIPPLWQEGGNLHQELQKVWKPRMLRPEQSNQRKLQTLRLLYLHQDTRQETERGNGVSLKAIPTLEYGIGARRLRVHHRREVDQQPMIEGGRKEVDGGGPSVKQLVKCLRTEGPLGTDNLIPSTQRVGEDVHLAGNELREKRELKLLAKPEDRLSHGVDSGGASTTLLLEVRQGGVVVGEHHNDTAPKRRKETLRANLTARSSW